MNTDDKPREILRAPLKNFRVIGDLTVEKSEWWKEFGRALEAARRDWDGRRG